MKVRKLILIAVAFVCIVALTAGVTLAAFNSSLTTTNVVTFGNISVELIDIYEKPSEGVRPGQVIDKVVSAKNNGNNTEYVRIHVEKSWTDNGVVLEDKDPDYIVLNFSNPELWVDGEDGYYYYQKPLEPGETAENLIESFSLPADWDMNGYFSIDGNITVRAEAVQYDNFSPEQNADGDIVGWWDIEIQEYNGGEVTVSSGSGENGQVVFTENAHEFVSLPTDDLFLNFKNVMPGDTVEQEIEIKNENNDKVNIYLYALQVDESGYTSAEQKEIADELMKLMQIELTSIDKDGNSIVIYRGPLYGESEDGTFNMHTNQNAISLGEYAKGDSSKIIAKLVIPPELDNRYANAVAKIKWVFTASGEGEETPPPVPPVTGESMKLVYILGGVLAGSLLIVIILTLVSKKKKEDE